MSDSNNPFATPSSNLQVEAGLDAPPTIEQALSRGYDFTVGNILSEAWALTNGAKGSILGGFAIFYLIMLAVSFVLNLIMAGVIGVTESVAMAFIMQIVSSLLIAAASYPFMAGVNMIGIRRAAGQPISFKETFGYLHKATPLVITAILMTLLIQLGILLLIIPGIYLSIAYILAIPLVVERGLSPWEALETSRKAITQHWFKVFGLFFVTGLVVTVSALPLFIGLVWTLPWAIIVMGVLYRTIFGVQPVASDTPSVVQ